MARTLRLSARVTGVGLVLVATAVAPTCRDDGADQRDVLRDGPVSQAAVNEAVAALCALLATDDPGEAARAFEDHAHDTIHEVADVVRDVDPALAGAVLEAKDPVETAVTAREPPASYRGDVRALLDAVADAVGALGIPMPTCGA